MSDINLTEVLTKIIEQQNEFIIKIVEQQNEVNKQRDEYFMVSLASILENSNKNILSLISNMFEDNSKTNERIFKVYSEIGNEIKKYLDEENKVISN